MSRIEDDPRFQKLVTAVQVVMTAAEFCCQAETAGVFAEWVRMQAPHVHPENFADDPRPALAEASIALTEHLFGISTAGTRLLDDPRFEEFYKST
jgi:hypothetical protein